VIVVTTLFEHDARYVVVFIGTYLKLFVEKKRSMLLLMLQVVCFYVNNMLWTVVDNEVDEI